MRQTAIEHRAGSLLREVEKVSFRKNDGWGVANRRPLIGMERCERATAHPTSPGEATLGISLGDPSTPSWRRLPALYPFPTRLSHA
jgi:hypothetical protein